MPNVIEPGTEDCSPNTLSGDIYLAFSALVDPGDLALVETAFKRISFAVASGWVANVVASITDTKYLQVSDGEIVGGDGGDGGGGGAPTDATYLVATANGTLSAERVATNTSTVTVDTNVAGQIRWNVPDASTADKGVARFATSGSATAGRAVEATDSRLSDDRDPTAHAASHMALGTDPIRLDELKAPTDVTTLNATTSVHGLLPKLDGSTGRFLNGNGGWTALAGPNPYIESPISLDQAATSAVAFTVFETAEIPEGFAGVVLYEYVMYGGSAASPVCGHHVAARANIRRATAGSLAVADAGQASSLGEGTTFTNAIAANGNNLRVQLTIGTTTTVYLRGVYRIYGAVLA